MSIRGGWFSSATDEAIIAASRVDQLGPISWQRLYDAFPSFEDLLAANRSLLISAGLTSAQTEAFLGRSMEVTSEAKVLEKLDIKLLTIDDKAYPELLKQINDPPLWLYVRGDVSVLKQPSLTIVGTRKPTPYALTALQSVFSPDLAGKIVSVSGLAYGVDKAVHQASIKAGGKTIAVLAGGLDRIYPVAHTNLAEEIIEHGGVLISEYPPFNSPQPYKFPIRNRIGAGLSRATVIIEAAIQSGSLTTAKAALDYNRDIFAVPGDVTRTSAEGTNFLIKRGAYLLDSSDQLLEYFGLEMEQSSLDVDSDAQVLLNLVTVAPLDLDAIVSKMDKSVEDVLGLVTQLELGGHLYQPQPGFYAQIRK